MKLKSLFIYVICVIIGVVVIDVGCRLLITPVFQNLPANTKAAVTYKFVSCKEPADLVIMGASRASHHYISKQMEDSLRVRVFNYGWDGRCVLYQYLCLLRAIENGNVKVAILDLSAAQLCNEWVDNRISDLYPYYWSNDTVKSMVDEVKHCNMSALMLSSLVQYNSQYLNLAAKIESEKGFTPLPYTGGPLDTTGMNYNIVNLEDHYSAVAVKYLKRMSVECKRLGILFVVCLSPTITHEDESYLMSLCRKNEIECWNYSDYINDPILFSDNTHLNQKGATEFTQLIIERIKEEYKL